MPVDRIGYGYGLFSAGDFGTEGVTQDGLAVISAASSASASSVNVKESGSLTSAASSTTTPSAVRVRFTTQATSATSSVTASAERVKDGIAAVSAACSFSAAARRVPQGSALINGACTVSAISTVNAWRYRNTGGTSRSTSSATASSVYSIIVKPTIQGQSAVSTTVVRKRNIALTSSTSSSGICYGVKKWEESGTASDSWSTISETSVTWTELTNDSNTWTNAA